MMFFVVNRYEKPVQRIFVPVQRVKGFVKLTKSGEKTTYYLLCKGKRKLIKGKDDDKLKKYLEDYNSLVEKYKIEYT